MEGGKKGTEESREEREERAGEAERGEGMATKGHLHTEVLLCKSTSTLA